jgi:hypothetical protein
MPRRDLLCYPFCYPRRLRSATRMWCRTAVAFPSFRSAIRRRAAASVASSIGGPFWRAGFLLVRGGRPSCASTLATGRSRSRDAAACARIARISSCTCGRTDGARSRSSTSNDPPGDPPPALAPRVPGAEFPQGGFIGRGPVMNFASPLGLIPTSAATFGKELASTSAATAFRITSRLRSPGRSIMSLLPLVARQDAPIPASLPRFVSSAAR